MPATPTSATSASLRARTPCPAPPPGNLRAADRCRARCPPAAQTDRVELLARAEVADHVAQPERGPRTAPGQSRPCRPSLKSEKPVPAPTSLPRATRIPASTFLIVAQPLGGCLEAATVEREGGGEPRRQLRGVRVPSLVVAALERPAHESEMGAPRGADLLGTAHRQHVGGPVGRSYGGDPAERRVVVGAVVQAGAAARSCVDHARQGGRAVLRDKARVEAVRGDVDGVHRLPSGAPARGSGRPGRRRPRRAAGRARPRAHGRAAGGRGRVPGSMSAPYGRSAARGLTRRRARPRSPQSSRHRARPRRRPLRADSGRRTARASRARWTRHASGRAARGTPR